MRKPILSMLMLVAAACAAPSTPASIPTPLTASSVSPIPLPSAIPTSHPTATPGPERFLASSLTPPEKGVFSLTGHSQGIASIWLTPGDKRAVSYSANGTLRVWDLLTSAPILTLCSIPGHTCDYEIVDVSKDGGRALARSASESGSMLRLLDLVSGNELASYRVASSDETMSISLAPEGDRFITISSKTGQIKIYDARNGAELRTIQPEKAGVSAMALAPDGKHLLLAPWQAGEGVGAIDFQTYLVQAIYFGLGESTPGELQIWNMETGELVRSLQGHTAAVFDIELTADGQRALSAALDGTVRVWDLVQGSELYRVETQLTPLSTGMQLSPAGSYAVLPVMDADQLQMTLQVLDIASGALISTLALDPEAAELELPWAMPIDERRAIGASADSDLIVWDLASGQELLRNDAGFAPDALAIASDGSQAVIGDRFNDLEIIDLDSLEVISRLDGGHTQAVTCMALMPDGKRVLTGAEDYSVRLWDIERGTETAMLPIQSRVVAVAVSLDGQRILVAGEHHLELWDLASNSRTMTIEGESGELLTFTADGRHFLVGSEWGGTVKLFNAETGRVERLFSNPPSQSFTDPPRLKAMHLLDGEDDLSMVYDGGISFFGLETGELLDSTEFGETAAVIEMISAMSPDGNRWGWSLYNSYRENGRIYVHDFERGGQVFESPDTTEQAHWIAFTPSGNQLLTATLRSVTLWDVETGEQLLVYQVDQAAGLVQQIAITPSGESALLLTGIHELATRDTFALITVLDLSPWRDQPQ